MYIKGCINLNKQCSRFSLVQFNKGLINLNKHGSSLDPVPAKCIISSLIKDLSTLISMVPALDPVPAKRIIVSLIKD